MRTFCIRCSIFVLLIGSSRLAKAISVSSPDGKIIIQVKTELTLRYSIQFRGKPLILDSPIALEFKDSPPLGNNLKLINHSIKEIREVWQNQWGKRTHVQNHCSQLTLAFQESSITHRKLNLIFRAYDDGAAIRYELPEDAGRKEVLTKESIHFRFAGNPTVWAADYGGYSSAQEAEFHKQKLSNLEMDTPYGTPLLVQANESAFVGITEADLQDWAGMYLSGITSSWGKPEIDSGIMHGGEPAKTIRLSVKDKQKLRLTVGDGGDGYDFDHADWANARLIDTNGKVTYLESLVPLTAKQGYGSLGKNKSIDGHSLKIGSQEYVHGLGSHSKGEIVYELGGQYARFEAEVGIDSEVGSKGSANFSVSTSSSARSDHTGLVTRLAPRPDGNGLVEIGNIRRSPWRVLLIGAHPGDLVESDLVMNLSEPCAIADTSWIKPGKCAWDHWWSSEVKMDTPTVKRYIQFAADMGFPYQLIDWTWYGDFNSSSSDITHITSSIDMPELLRFAKERNVRLFDWLHSSDVDMKLKIGKLDEAFALYEKWGLAGVKIDFMNRDDQEMVNWYHTVIKLAAMHHLMVDFHGAYKPTGTQRAYPNQITREGVMGEEYDKFSTGVTPEHDCTLPFTRMLAGPMDYTPGGFLNRSKDRWKRTSPTEVMGTRCHELAKFVIFDSPLTVLCDDPEHYYNQPGLEFLRVVPTVWDDTKIVDGSVGEFILSARLSGRDWFLGGITNWSARTVKIPLTFLGKGSYAAHIFSDAADAGENAEHLTESTRTVTSSELLTVSMASGGGIAVQFTRK